MGNISILEREYQRTHRLMTAFDKDKDMVNDGYLIVVDGLSDIIDMTYEDDRRCTDSEQRAICIHLVGG